MKIQSFGIANCLRCNRRSVVGVGSFGINLFWNAIRLINNSESVAKCMGAKALSIRKAMECFGKPQLVEIERILSEVKVNGEYSEELIGELWHVPSKMTAVGIDTIKHWSEHQHKHQTQYAIYNDSIFGGFANASFFPASFSRVDNEKKKKTFFAIIRIQRLNESWKRAESVSIKCIHVRARLRYGYSGPGRHICGHISNKPAFENGSDAAGGSWCWWWHFLRELYFAAREKRNLHLKMHQPLAHLRSNIHHTLTIPKVTLMA